MVKHVATSSLKYPPGTMFSLPLERGGYGLGIIARITPWPSNRMCLMYVYGFGKVYDSPPSAEEARQLTFEDAVAVGTGRDAPLRKGWWHVVHQMEPFDPEEWPVAPQIAQVLPSPDGPITYDLVRPPRVELIEDMYLRADNIDARHLVTESDFDHLPLIQGLLIDRALEGTLDYAIRTPNRFCRAPISRHARDIWYRIIYDAKRLGLYPKSEPWTKDDF